jgi:hypothetical protein
LKRIFFAIVIFYSQSIFSQNSEYLHSRFCKNLNKVFELGRQDNFDSYDGTMVKQSPLLPVPGYSIKLDEFAITYADKDHRFVGKTNLNLDSLSALQKLEELKAYVGYCLDSTQWTKWTETAGDDSTTVFFKELKEVRADAKDLNLILAVTLAAPKVYTVNLYVKRRK